MSHPFTIRSVNEAIESLPPAETDFEIQMRYHWSVRAIEVEYIRESGREELAEQLRDFYAGEFDAKIGPLLREIEEARQVEAEALITEAYRLNRIADELADYPNLAASFARDLGRDKRANATVKGITTRTGRTR